MAKHTGRAQDKAQGNIQLASVDPTATPDASAYGKETTTSDEPFGLFTFVAPDGLVWVKWRKVAADIRAAEPTLMRCLADENGLLARRRALRGHRERGARARRPCAPEFREPARE